MDIESAESIFVYHLLLDTLLHVINIYALLLYTVEKNILEVISNLGFRNQGKLLQESEPNIAKMFYVI